MFRTMLSAKIHQAVVTGGNVNYIGSITIDKDLLSAVDIIENEKVQVVNINNGARWETYAIKGEKGVVCLNGGGARLVQPGDKVIVMSYKMMTEEQAASFIPKIAFVDGENKLTKLLTEEKPHTIA